MALSGIFVECGMACTVHGEAQVSAYLGQPYASENKTSAGTTTLAVPAISGTWILTIIAAADSFIAVGPSPNASAEPRRFLAANQRLDIVAVPGDKVNWAAA